MSDANRTKILFLAESSFGVLPTQGAETLAELRFLSSALRHEKVTVMSEEIRSDRARTDLIEVGKAAGGSLETEFIVGGYNPFILGALMASAWTAGNSAVTANSLAAGQTITATAGTFSAATQAAKFVKVTGFVNSGNNGIFRVVSCTGTVLTLEAGSLTGADETGVSVTVAHNYARNGVTQSSFLLEQQYLSLDTPAYIQFAGMEINEWVLGMEARARIMQTFNFMGTRAYTAAATHGDGTPTAPSTRNICNTTGNIGTIVWGGSALAANVLAFNMTLNNNLRDRPALSRETSLLHGTGRCEPNGTISTYFEDIALFEAFVDHSSASLVLPIRDPAGNLFGITLPKLQFPSGFPEIQGINTDVQVDLDFNAVYDSASGYTIQVDQLDLV